MNYDRLRQSNSKHGLPLDFVEGERPDLFKACGLMSPALMNGFKSEEVIRDRLNSLRSGGLGRVLEGSWGRLGALWGSFLIVLGALGRALGCSWVVSGSFGTFWELLSRP